MNHWCSSELYHSDNDTTNDWDRDNEYEQVIIPNGVSRSNFEFNSGISILKDCHESDSTIEKRTGVKCSVTSVLQLF